MSGPVVIAVVNHKGGCAKTTTAVNIAAALAVGNEEMGIAARRVLLVDLDPKGNVATTFGIDKKSLGPTMNELFKGGVDGSPVTLNECLLGPEVLTGAMRPFSLYTSDGEFNLGGAITASQILPAGVWGVMNGRVFAAEALKKDVEQGRFDT